MDGVEGVVVVAPEGLEDTTDRSVDFESWLLVVVVSIDSTNVTATATACDSVSLEELVFVLSTLLDWVQVSDGVGTESRDAVADWESDLLSVDWDCLLYTSPSPRD